MRNGWRTPPERPKGSSVTVRYKKERIDAWHTAAMVVHKSFAAWCRAILDHAADFMIAEAAAGRTPTMPGATPAKKAEDRPNGTDEPTQP